MYIVWMKRQWSDWMPNLCRTDAELSKMLLTADKDWQVIVTRPLTVTFTPQIEDAN